MGKSLNHARAVAKSVRLASPTSKPFTESRAKSVTVEEALSEGYKVKRAVERDRYMQQRRELMLIAELTCEGKTVTKGKTRHARGSNELHRVARKALPMQSHLWM